MDRFLLTWLITMVSADIGMSKEWLSWCLLASKDCPYESVVAFYRE